MSLRGEIVQAVFRWADDLLGGSPGRFIKVIIRPMFEWLGLRGVLAVLLIAATAICVVYVVCKRQSGQLLTWSVVRDDLRGMRAHTGAHSAGPTRDSRSVRRFAPTALLFVSMFIAIAIWDYFQRA